MTHGSSKAVPSEAGPLPWSSESQERAVLAGEPSGATETMWGKLWGMTQGQMDKLEQTVGLPAHSRIARSAVSY
jgi:hypothetical protein